ncbi:MAG TPA: hypothetical protein EYO59_03865 [Chromatiaceae bacterium]|nr:hypothetical protein [Chromatiaceae bacterium]
MSHISRRDTCLNLFGKDHPVNKDDLERRHCNMKKLTGVCRPGKTANDRANGAHHSKRRTS